MPVQCTGVSGHVQAFEKSLNYDTRTQVHYVATATGNYLKCILSLGHNEL